MSKQIYKAMMKELEINDRDLSGEMTQQPSKFAYYGSLAAKAARTHHKEKIKLKELEAHISKAFRDIMRESDPNTRITDSMIRTFIANEPEHQEQTQAVMRAQYAEDLLITAKEAFRQRSQLLLQLARLRAEEMYAPNQAVYKRGKENLPDKAQFLGGKKE